MISSKEKTSRSIHKFDSSRLIKLIFIAFTNFCKNVYSIFYIALFMNTFMNHNRMEQINTKNIKFVTDRQCPLQISRNRPPSGIPRMQKIVFAAYSSRRLSLACHASVLFVQSFKISRSRNEYRYFDTP